MQEGEWRYFDDPTLVFTGKCCFVELDDSGSDRITKRSIWIKDEFVVASWVSETRSKSLQIGFCMLAKYFLGVTKSTRHDKAVDFFEMLESSFFGKDLASKVSAPKECKLATGQKGYILHQVCFSYVYQEESDDYLSNSCA